MHPKRTNRVAAETANRRARRTFDLQSDFLGGQSSSVYFPVILDAWSRRVVGYALGRQIDTRLNQSDAAASALDSAYRAAIECARTQGVKRFDGEPRP